MKGFSAKATFTAKAKRNLFSSEDIREQVIDGVLRARASNSAFVTVGRYTLRTESPGPREKK